MLGYEQINSGTVMFQSLLNDARIKALATLLFIALTYKIMPSIFWFIVMLCIVVFVHEFGHFIVARIFGVKVEVFSIGFGHEIIGWEDRYGTRWKIAWMPLGGYVKMLGDSDPASSPDYDNIKNYSQKERDSAFYFKPLYQKALVVFAGPAFNYLLAIIILGALYFTYGKVHISNEIVEVKANSPAEKAGLQSGDKIVEMDGSAVKSFDQIHSAIAMNVGTPIHLKIVRRDNVQDINITPELIEEKDPLGNMVKIGFIGIVAGNPERIQLGVLGALTTSVYDTYNISITLLKAIGQIIAGDRGLDQLGGPVKIAQYSGETAKLGFVAFLGFIALISINLGLINLMPFPMLDGGHLLYYSIEKITGREIPAKIQLIALKVGFALLMLLMLYVTLHDIKSLFK